ncbi:MAG: GGDEF domain-containing protein [Bryobacteraceae bacterium]|jgi:GGDEF domain-containing protein
MRSDQSDPQAAELRSIIALLMNALSSDSLTSSSGKGELEAFRGRIDSPNGDLFRTRTQLAHWLTRWRREIEQRLAGAASGGQPRAGEAAADARSGADPCTGLLNRYAADAALARAAEEGRQVYAAVFILHRLQALNKRFGYAVGDRLLLLQGQHLARQLAPEDQLFRWLGPSFLALLDRSGPLEAVVSEVGRVGSNQFHTNVDLGSRSVLIPVSSRWHVVASSDYNSALDFASALRALITAAPP